MASCCGNLSHPKQQSTDTNVEMLCRNCWKPLNERDQDDSTLEIGFCMVEYDFSLESSQWPACNSVSGNLQHPTHIPYLSPPDFYLFGPFKNVLSGKRSTDQKK
jgi:hypothetical protein